MQEQDIAHLAALARIKLAPSEVAELQTDIQAIVAYVGTIAALTAATEDTKQVGAQYNVFRQDTVTNAAGAYTERLLRAAPATQNGYVVVKKILSLDDQ